MTTFIYLDPGEKIGEDNQREKRSVRASIREEEKGQWLLGIIEEKKKAAISLF